MHKLVPRMTYITGKNTTEENIGTAWRLQQTTSLVCVKQFPA
ncbi:hypothetical protein QVO32_02070 [Bacteroides gallinaceum]|nr:hypothetical protein [Bacteroides gallinaceum]